MLEMCDFHFDWINIFLQTEMIKIALLARKRRLLYGKRVKTFSARVGWKYLPENLAISNQQLNG